MRLASVVIAAALLVVARPARADDETATTKPSYRVVVDRVAHEPASITGTRLSIQLSALTLQGQRLDLTDPKTIKTFLGSSELKAPYSLGTFDGTDGAMAIVVVVQATLEYGDVLPVIAETIEQSLLSQLADSTQLAILPYGEATGSGKLASLKAARGKLGQLAHDGTAGDPALLETVERALLLLRKAKTEPEGRALRKMILVIGDGRDRAGDRERVTKLGERAGREGVRIHSFAFSPTDQRRPLLLLGELSKRSHGTFRWLQRAEAGSWTPAFAQMQDEINKQYVLTYYLNADEDPAGKKLKVVTVGRTEATSNELKVPEASCNGEPCAGYCAANRCVIPQQASGRGILGWLLLIGGIALGAILVLGVIGYVITNRQPRIPLPPGVAPPVKSKPPKNKPPASVPPHAAIPGSMPPQVVAPVTGVVPHLMFLNGPRMGERIPLRHGFMIGKAPGCDLMIEDGYTSTHHAQIGMDHFGNCRLYDRGSTNGTFLNGVRVTESVLEHGVSLKIGSTELRFLAQ